MFDIINNNIVKFNNINNIQYHNRMYYIPSYNLYGIYRLSCHFNITSILNAFKNLEFDTKTKFLNIYKDNEEKFWLNLYNYDQNNINKNDLLLTYNNQNNKSYFKSSYSLKGAKILSFNFSDKQNQFNVCIYPKYTAIQIFNGNRLFLTAKTKGNSLLNWKIENKVSRLIIGDEIYQRLQEIIFCLNNGLEIKDFPYMGYEYYQNKFKKDKYFKALDFYLYNNFNIATNAFNPYILEMICANNIMDKNIVLKKLFICGNERLKEANNRKYESNYIIDFVLVRCINILTKYYGIDIIPFSSYDIGYNKWNNFLDNEVPLIGKLYKNMINNIKLPKIV